MSTSIMQHQPLIYTSSLDQNQLFTTSTAAISPICISQNPLITGGNVNYEPLFIPQLNFSILPTSCSFASTASTSLNSLSSPVLSSPKSDRSLSPENLKAKRGRPQQEIADDEQDPSSQRKKHRRLYARKYRASMRRKIDEVARLNSEIEELEKRLADRERQLQAAHSELLHKNLLLQTLASSIVQN